MEGSSLGTSDGDNLIHQLYTSLDLIKAGNTSTKLQCQVNDLLQVLTKHSIINEYQQRKIINDYVAFA